jgi:hypothetical protein
MACLGLSVTACPSYSTVTMRDGTVHEGRPVASDQTRLAMENKQGRFVLCKNKIEDIDHPGDFEAIGGVLLVAGGIALTAATVIADRRSDMPSIGPYFGLAHIIAGTVLALRGGRRWLDAKETTGWPPSDSRVLDEPCAKPSGAYGVPNASR